MKLDKKKPCLFKLKKYTSTSGNLISINALKQNQFPFDIKRVFFVKAKKNAVRGNHAHRKCSQLLICLSGKLEIEIINSNLVSKKYNLDEQDNNAIFLPIMHWVKIKFKNNHTLLGVLCNYKYDKKKEYINNFQKFKNLK